MSITSVTPTSPANNTVVAPGAALHVVSTAVSTLGEITGWQIYLDGLKIYNIAKTSTVSVPQTLDQSPVIDPNTALGNHTVTIKAYDSSGAVGQAQRTINVQQPTAGVVTINETSPVAGGSVNADGTIHVVASATTTATSITGWQIWFNSVLLYDPNSGNGGAIDQTVTIPAGTAPGNYPLTVKAWDNSGSIGQVQRTLTVPTPPSPPPVQPGQPLGSKSVASLTAHNVTGAANYNQTNFPTLFTGSTNHDGVVLATDPALNDDSENAAAPMVISKESVRNLMPSAWSGRIIMYAQFWWGRSNHPAIGVNDRDPATLQNIVQGCKDRGYDVISPDWYHYTKTSVYNNSDLDLLKQACVVSGINFIITIDQQFWANNGSTAATKQADIIAAINSLMDAYAVHPNYEHYTYNGVSRPLIFLWDMLRVGGTDVDWSVVHTQANHQNPLIIQYQASGFSTPGSDGAFSWVDTNADKAGSPASGSSYLSNSFLPACSSNQDKICISSVWKGFNGTLTKSTSWSLGKYLDQRHGQTWLDVWKVNSDYVASGKRLDYIGTVTLDDYQEGSAVQGGIRTDVAINWTISGNLATFTMTGNENSVRRYNLWGTTDGITAYLLATTTPGQPKQFDLTALPGLVNGGNYTLYLEAQGMPSLQSHMAPQTFQRTFVINVVNPTAALSADVLSGTSPLTVNFDASQSAAAAQPITDYRFDFGDSTAVQEGVNQAAQHVYQNAGAYTCTLTVTASDGGVGTASVQISVSSPTPVTTQVAIAGITQPTPTGTATVYEIPLKAQPQSVDITLNGKKYTLVVRWNGANTSWMMDIKDSKGKLLVAGIALVTGADLLGQYKYLNLGGKLVVQTDGGVKAIPTFQDLGGKSHLFFIVTT